MTRIYHYKAAKHGSGALACSGACSRLLTVYMYVAVPVNVLSGPCRMPLLHGCPDRQCLHRGRRGVAKMYRSSIMDAEPPRASSRSQIVSARRSFAWTGLLQSSPANPSATTQHLCVAASVTTNAWRHSGDGSSALVSPGLKSAHDVESQPQATSGRVPGAAADKDRPSASSSFSARLRTTTRLGSPLARFGCSVTFTMPCLELMTTRSSTCYNNNNNNYY